jgi:hypothetical protein
MSKRWWLPIAVALTCGVASAQDEDSIAKIRKDLNTVMRTANEKQENPKEGDFLKLIDRCWKVYDQSAGEPEEFVSLNEILQLSTMPTGRSVKCEDHWRDAISKIVKDFVDDPRLADLVMGLSAPPKLSKDRDTFIATIKANSKCPDVKAAFEFRDVSPLVDQQGDGKLDEAKTKALFERLRKLAADYPTAKVPRYGMTYKDWVEKTIYRMEHLKIGAVAPEIDGQDLDGVKFKLSDYRGKVVVLDFWGHW